MGKWITRINDNLAQISSFNTDNVDIVGSKPKNTTSMSTLSVLPVSIVAKNFVSKPMPTKNLNGMCLGNCGYMLPFCNCLRGGTHE